MVFKHPQNNAPNSGGKPRKCGEILRKVELRIVDRKFTWSWNHLLFYAQFYKAINDAGQKIEIDLEKGNLIGRKISLILAFQNLN